MPWEDPLVEEVRKVRDAYVGSGSTMTWTPLIAI